MRVIKLIPEIKDKIPYFYQTLTFTKEKINMHKRYYRVADFKYYNSGLSECHGFYKPISKLMLIGCVLFIFSCKSNDLDRLRVCSDNFHYDSEKVYGYIVDDNGKRDSIIIDEIKLSNTIYKSCRSFMYEVNFQHEDILMVDTVELLITGNEFKSSDLQREILYISHDFYENKKKIETTLSSYGVNKSNFLRQFDKTGLKEREDEIWLHPMRHNQYCINETAPFPMIKYPLRIGNYWSASIKTFEPWEVWKDLNIHSEYKITDTIYFDYSVTEKIKCWKIDAYSEYDETINHVVLYFNENKGFVKIDQKFQNGIKMNIILLSVNDL